MATCDSLPTPPKGWKCRDCWQCRYFPGKNYGSCTKVTLNGPSNSISTCEAAGLYTEKTDCLKKCGKPPIDCYTCFISPNQQRGRCVLTHPLKTGTNEPVDRCEDTPNTFSTIKQCQSQCTSRGPVNPQKQCWAVQNSDTCKCTFGFANGPDGPLESCLADQGFYNDEQTCSSACKEKKSTFSYDKLILMLVLGGGILFLASLK